VACKLKVGSFALILQPNPIAILSGNMIILCAHIIVIPRNLFSSKWTNWAVKKVEKSKGFAPHSPYTNFLSNLWSKLCLKRIFYCLFQIIRIAWMDVRVRIHSEVFQCFRIWWNMKSFNVLESKRISYEIFYCSRIW